MGNSGEEFEGKERPAEVTQGRRAKLTDFPCKAVPSALPSHGWKGEKSSFKCFPLKRNLSKLKL